MADEFDDDGVPWHSERDCEASAATLRKLLGVEAGPLPHIMEVLDRARQRIAEAKDLALLPRPDEVMGRALAYAKSADREIVARQSIVEGAIDDEPLPRYVLIHELEHIIFHKGPRKFRIATGNQRLKFLSDQTSAEWQADYIARAMFMPPEMVQAAESSADLARTARVPLAEAEARTRQLWGRHVSVFDKSTEPSTSTQPVTPLSDFDALKLRLWKDLPTIPGEHAAKSRLCGMFRILWSEYGLTSQCGWFLDRGKIVASFTFR